MQANQRKGKKSRYFRIKPKRDSCYFHSVFSSDFLDSWSAFALRISGIWAAVIKVCVSIAQLLLSLPDHIKMICNYLCYLWHTLQLSDNTFIWVCLKWLHKLLSPKKLPSVLKQFQNTLFLIKSYSLEFVLD